MDRNQRPRQLRKDATFPERLLWSRLRARRLFNLKFRRQHPIGPYIVDFYNEAHRLVIELDGDSHRGRFEYDKARQEKIESLENRVLRVSNDDVLRDIDAVLVGIARACGVDVRY